VKAGDGCVFIFLAAVLGGYMGFCEIAVGIEVVPWLEACLLGKGYTEPGP
jgi:hypothetical protein